jgi:predicted acetyltransferase
VTQDHNSLPIDAESAQRVAAAGLRFALVDTSDAVAFDSWMQADSRGFHGAKLSDEELAWWREGIGDRRTSAVLDGDEVVATVNAWPSPMTVPGGGSVPSWAISSVTVSPTHRRRGLARALLEAELRTAAALGLPLAILTVSESTLYGRYGFGPAAFASDYVIDTKRALWTGPEPAGRVRFVTIEQWREGIAPLHERARLASPGEVEVFALRWDQISGVKSDDKGRLKQMRAIAYHDEAGELQGLALYKVGGGEDDFTKHEASVFHLCAATDAAYAALWRFLLELDLTTELRAGLRAVDEPVRWMVKDQRAIKQTVLDHHWVRILDVKAALEARDYERDGVLEFQLTDELGFAAGGWRLEVVGGRGTVTAGTGGPEFTVAELSAAYLGAVPPVMPELELLRTARAPWLGTWY